MIAAQKEEIRSLIERGDLKSALEMYEEYANTSSDVHYAILLQGRYNSEWRRYNLGLIHFYEWDRSRTMIGYSLANLIDGKQPRDLNFHREQPRPKEKTPNDFSNIKVGDSVYITGQPGFSMAQMYADWHAVTEIKTKYNPETGASYQLFKANQQWFGMDGYPMSEPWAYMVTTKKS